MFKKYIYIILFLWVQFTFGQNQTRNWYFGDKAAIEFSPEVISKTDSQMNALIGTSSISDINGDLLFYTDGKTVWNKNHEVMENGENLVGQLEGTQSVIIIPKPNDPKKYYIFYTRNTAGNISIEARGLYYSLVSFENNPLGEVRSFKRVNRINTRVTANKLTAIHNEDGTAVWLITTIFDSTTNSYEFNAYKIDENFDDDIPPNYTIIKSPISDLFNEDVNFGQVKASISGNKVALAAGEKDGWLSVYDFNRTTGKLTNEAKIKLVVGFGFWEVPIGLEFSPNEKYLYYTYLITGEDSEISQSASFGLNQLDLTTINDPFNNPLGPEKISLASPGVLRYGGVQIGNDRKIYVSTYAPGIPTPFLSVINKPNSEGLSSNYVSQALNLASGSSKQGLPNFIQTLFASQIISENVCFGDAFMFSAESYLNINSILWDFGDGNTSRDLTPTHTYASAGDYIVKARINLGVTQVQVEKLVTVYSLPNLNSNQRLVQCDSDADGFAPFNLFDIYNDNPDFTLSSDPGLSLTFFSTRVDAEQNTNQISNPTNYTNTVANEEIFVRAINPNGCLSITSFFLEVNFIPLVTVPPLYACQNPNTTNVEGTFDLARKRVQISASINGNVRTSITFFLSEIDAQTNTNEITNLSYVSKNTTVFARIDDGDTGCGGIYSFDLIVNPIPNISNVKDSYEICAFPLENPPVIISADLDSDRVEWSQGNRVLSTDYDFTLERTGTFKLTVFKTTNGTECSTSKEFTVSFPDAPSFKSLEAEVINGKNQIDIDVLGNSNYEFSLDNVNFKGNGLSYSFLDVDPGIYTIYVRDINSCEPSIKDQVTVVGFPKYFTPNDDGVNDRWLVPGATSQFFKSVDIQIFNRFGKQLFKLTIDNSEFGWDGTYQGIQMPSSDYWFSARLVNLNDEIIQESGNFSLIRL